MVVVKQIKVVQNVAPVKEFVAFAKPPNGKNIPTRIVNQSFAPSLFPTVFENTVFIVTFTRNCP